MLLLAADTALNTRRMILINEINRLEEIEEWRKRNAPIVSEKLTNALIEDIKAGKYKKHEELNK